jgi:hypothetical protein
MNQDRSLSQLASLFVVGLAVAASVAPATAQTSSAVSKGKITLPIEVQWGGVSLPPGEYTYTLDSGSLGGVLRLRRAGHYVAVLQAVGISEARPSRSSELILIRRGRKGIVRTLYLSELGLALSYVRYPRGLQTIAQAPELIQRIPVSSFGL